MTNIALAALPPVHPGEILREDVFPATGKGKTEIARALGISRQYLHDILTEKKPVTTAVALRLGRFLGNSPEMWLNLQQSYDLRIESERLAAELDAIPQLTVA